ncbi:hypothetical protein MPER_01880, partial [Moniliophthora perniciosa FA553]
KLILIGTPQTDHKVSNGNQYHWNRGKSLGGSSAINFSAWTVPPKSDIDDWERLCNRGWNWENYEKHIELMNCQDIIHWDLHSRRIPSVVTKSH